MPKQNAQMRAVAGPPLFLPLAAALVLQAFISSFQLDLALANLLYQLEGGQWLLRDNWFFSTLLHSGGRRVSIGLLLIVIAAFAASFFADGLRQRRRVIGFLMMAPLSATLLISWLKHVTGVDCPWDISVYGGDQPYRPLLSTLLMGGGDGACFPAGHASAGYAWVAVYFAAQAVYPAWQRRLLVAALALGALFGVCQQLRGAHFLSHDLWSLTLCWYTSVLFARLMLFGKPHAEGEDNESRFRRVEHIESTGSR